MKVVTMGSALAVGLALLARGGEPQGATYEVWKKRQDLFETPHGYARILATVEKGACLAVLGEKGKWGRVRVSEKDLEGWTVLDAPPRVAGVRATGLEGAASQASLAAAAKAFDDFSREVARQRPDVEEAFAALRAASVSPQEVEEFARAGGLQ